MTTTATKATPRRRTTTTRISFARILFRAAAIAALSAISAVRALALPPPSPSRKGFVAVSARTAAVGRGVGGAAPSATRRPKPVFLLRSAPDDDDADAEITADDGDENEKSILDKINDFLDTPILDANDRSDQGPVAEALKEFVRDEPELAQVTFSVAVVAVLVAVTRLATSL
eukprot:CAMPEP_0197177096 /NCGR_PEP_ID=MMETSP1423-20130617/2824_1 /TAXON_ID=476441 /ORGANISM="Pseudo-nitzschia heimii, Strain UNC1101" /LENGTH=172 /DNA_ID=CAMNT_0042626589 /DNA_START=77 /DNA_END=595 /DNA_ORIENTATION=+